MARQGVWFRNSRSRSVFGVKPCCVLNVMEVATEWGKTNIVEKLSWNELI